MAKCDKQNTCPKCGSNEITYGSSELLDDSIGYEFTCDSCGCEGIEWYDLVFAYSVSNDDWSFDIARWLTGDCSKTRGEAIKDVEKIRELFNEEK